jgi:PPOX class probable F420-dependent enzyme
MGVRLTPEEQWATLEAAHTGIFTSLRRDGAPVALPVWFAVVDRRIYLRTPAKAKKVARIRNDERASFLVESGLAWKELKAVHLTGRAVLLEPGEETERAGQVMNAKYRAYRTERKTMPDASKKHYARFVWIRFDPEGKPLTWNNAKLHLKQDDEDGDGV